MKQMILLSVTVFSLIGAYVPALFGNTDMFSGWSIFGGFIGGIFGVWLGVFVSKRWG